MTTLHMAEDGESAILVIESGLNEMARAIINHERPRCKSGPFFIKNL
jgi:hypothetical protein